LKREEEEAERKFQEKLERERKEMEVEYVKEQKKVSAADRPTLTSPDESWGGSQRSFEDSNRWKEEEEGTGRQPPGVSLSPLSLSFTSTVTAGSSRERKMNESDENRKWFGSAKRRRWGEKKDWNPTQSLPPSKSRSHHTTHLCSVHPLQSSRRGSRDPLTMTGRFTPTMITRRTFSLLARTLHRSWKGKLSSKSPLRMTSQSTTLLMHTERWETKIPHKSDSDAKT
jgi:hypothetical protein